MMITDDLSIEILKRLPIKTIFRSRSVCKSWNSVISSPFFLQIHTSFSASSTLPKPYLLFDSAKLTLTICNPIHPPHLTSLTCPIKTLISPIIPSPTLVDVIHGVLCVSYSEFDSTILWNPSIHKYLPLPAPSVSAGNNTFYFRIGFGFDTSTNDFKVVRVWNRRESKSTPIELCCEIYSSREGVWRKKKGFDDIMANEVFDLRTKIGCFCNGCVYWFQGRNSVLVFDCVEEVFRKIDLPEEVSRMMNSNVAVLVTKFAEYSGKLVVVMYSIIDRIVKMWKMEEHGAWIEVSAVYEPIPNVLCDNGVLMLVKYGDIVMLECWGIKRVISSILDKDGLERFHLEGRLFEETMLLMDSPNSKSCMKQETVLF